MDKSLQALCESLKKIIWQLKPQNNALSFLIITGRTHQGKSTLLRQSHFDHVVVDAEMPVEIYFNSTGVIVELGESWLNQSKNLLQYTLKQLNRCHRTLRINGIILCVDINNLLDSEPLKFAEHSKLHTQLLTRFGQSLNYRVDTAIVFTKMDALAGFCEFFQNDHSTELRKPLGFSLDWATRQGKILNNYKIKFEHFIEALGQQVIPKMHPARSSIKRTLIREFPLQLASLGTAIQALIHTISPTLFRVHALYFTSGEQGGISVDRLNKKIQHEYALTVQDKFPQSINHRAYFIEGALLAFQNQTKQSSPAAKVSHKWVVAGLSVTLSLGLLWVGSHHLISSRQLDKVSKELLAYDALLQGNSGTDPAALYHLTKASALLDKLHANALYLPIVQQMKLKLHQQTQQHLNGDFLPTILSEIEQTIIDNRQSQVSRYQALKIYLMLGEPTKFSQSEVVYWFQNHWQKEAPTPVVKKKISLLKETLHQPLQPIPINRQIVSDVRNYLNALPASYLYYTLAKSSFTKDTQSLLIEGFDLADRHIPAYFTKQGFHRIIDQLPEVATRLQTENWVLARQDLNNLPALLQQAYCYEYVVWWQNFMHKSSPQHIHDYQQAHQLAESLHRTDSFSKLVALIQQQTSPLFGENADLFNQSIASKFTELSLMSQSAVSNLNTAISELEKFLNTLSVVNDQGRTAFMVTKARFESDNLSTPLSLLYREVSQLPDPISAWAKRIADDTWFILIDDTRNYINRQWQQTVVRDYRYTISNRYPFNANTTQEVALADFDSFFSRRGVLNTFIEQNLRPFLDTSKPQWQLKEVNNYVLPISAEMINELIRANVISNMFFPDNTDTSKIEFTLQKLSLDPVVSSLELIIGTTTLKDTQDSESLTRFHWPLSNARLSLKSIEGNHYELDENGPWAFFRMLQKVNVLVDEQDSSNLQILFEVNGNSGRYVLKTDNKVNPFIPGILNGFTLNDAIA
jgi:intracellular multiplication protein IcmF